MKRPLLALLVGVMTVLAFGQAPMIEVGTTSIEETLAVGDSVIVKVLITNVGNRDLEWEADRFAPDVTFVKEDYANPELSENQDRIAPTVWLTRDDEQGQYNIFSEASYSGNPVNTQWAEGKVGEVPEQDYTDWDNVMEWRVPDKVGRDLSIYLEEYDQYLDLKYLSWTSGGNGGGFSYVRSGFPYWIEPVMVDDMPIGISGEIIPTQSDTLTFILSAKELTQGDYPCAVEIFSNDTNNPVVSIPIDLMVTGEPEVGPIGSYVFGNVAIGLNSTLTEEVFNIGDGNLIISSITTTESVFVPSMTSDTVLPGSALVLDVMFAPVAEMSYVDTVVLTTNDSENMTVKIPVTGTGILPSESSVLKTPGVQTLVFGATINDTVIIKNTGASTLNYEIMFMLDSMPVIFTKEDWADPSMEANQDRIASNVWITRGDKQGLFNAAIEDGWDSDAWDSPKGTEWNDEFTINTTAGEYSNWNNAGDPRELVRNDYCLLLTDYKRYFDIDYHAWTSAAQGGGFSYTRTEVPGWITTSGNTGSLAPGDSIIKVVTFNANNAYAGMHEADLVVKTNDPSNFEQMFPLNLTITGEPEIEVNPLSLDLGEVIEADTSMLMLEIMNTGSSVLTVSGITNDSSSVMLGTLPTMIQAGMTAELMVKWVPDYIGAFMDTIYISSDDSDEAMVKVPISGDGVGQPGLYLSVSELADTLVSGTVDVHDVVIKNTGESDLMWSINLISDQSPVTFTKLDSVDWTMAENQDRISPSIWITRANDRGIFNIVDEDDHDRNSSPTGTQWSSQPVMAMGSYNNWINAFSWPIPDDLIGKTTGMQTTVGQFRQYDVTWHAWTSKARGGGFSYSRQEVPEWISGPSVTGTIPAGDSVVYPVTLSAGERNAGVYNATVEVHTNIPGMAPSVIDAMIKVTGEPMIDVSPTLYGFGTVGIGVNSDTMMFTVTNSGTDTLKISSMSADSSVFTFDATMMDVPAGEEGMFSVVFSPMYAVTYLDTIMIISDATNEPMLKIPISGAGVEVGDIYVMPTMLTDVVRYNDTTTYKVKVKNEGGDDLSWEVQGYPVMFTKADMADWTLEANQDRITSNVWITRQNTQGLFNIVQEASYNANAPTNTLWAFGYTHELVEDDYDVWVDAINGSAQSMVDSNISLYLPMDGIYYDVWFHSYSGGGPGGGFSYTRTGYPAWMESSDSGSVISSGDSVEITISFFSNMASIGDNMFDLTILSNDPDEAATVVELDFSVYSLMVENELSDVVENVGFGTQTVDFANVFSSADGDAISYIVANAYDSVATIGVSGTEITITEAGTGTTVISVRAQTESGDVAYADFNFRVNNAPVVSNPVANVTLTEGFGSNTVNVSTVFTDPDGDALSYEVASGSTDVVTATMSGSSVILNEAGVGTSTITLSADDGIVAAPTATTFDVTVEEGAGTGINEFDVNSFALHPNPSSGNVVLSFGHVINGEVTINVTSISGKQVYSEAFIISSDEYNLDLDVLNDGLYMVEIHALDFYEIKKLIIEK